MRVSPLAFKEPVGVIGSGSFAVTIAHLLTQNVNVLLYARRPEVVDEINTMRRMYRKGTRLKDVVMTCMNGFRRQMISAE